MAERTTPPEFENIPLTPGPPILAWEYIGAVVFDYAGAEKALGRQGWELVAVVSHSGQDIGYFKRPLQGG